MNRRPTHRRTPGFGRCRWLPAMLVAVALVASACGSDGDQAQQDKELEDALVAQGMAGAPGGAVDEQQARCAARRAIDDVGADELRAAGAPDDIRTEQLSREDQDKVADAIIDCVDVEGTLRAGMTDTLPISDEGAACVATDLVESGALHDAIVASMARGDTGGGALQEEVTNRALPSLTKCLSPADMARVLTGQ